jgi:hypothetical protein
LRYVVHQRILFRLSMLTVTALTVLVSPKSAAVRPAMIEQGEHRQSAQAQMGAWPKGAR